MKDFRKIIGRFVMHIDGEIVGIFGDGKHKSILPIAKTDEDKELYKWIASAINEKLANDDVHKYNKVIDDIFDAQQYHKLRMNADANKYTFLEFVAAQEADDFNNIGPKDITWAAKFLNEFAQNGRWEFNYEHFGDCTKFAGTCSLCLLKQLLQEYEDYFFRDILPE
jgi:hypothetical protein